MPYIGGQPPSPQAFLLPRKRIAVPDTSRHLIAPYRPVGYVVALLRQPNRGRFGAGRVISPDHIQLWHGKLANREAGFLFSVFSGKPDNLPINLQGFAPRQGARRQVVIRAVERIHCCGLQTVRAVGRSVAL